MKKARPAWYYWEYFAPQQIRLSPNLLGAVKEITVVNSGRVWTPSFLNTTSLKMDLDMQPPQRFGVALVWVARNKSRSSWAELGTSAVLLWLISAPQHTISQLALSSRLLACLGSGWDGLSISSFYHNMNNEYLSARHTPAPWLGLFFWYTRWLVHWWEGELLSRLASLSRRHDEPRPAPHRVTVAISCFRSHTLHNAGCGPVLAACQLSGDWAGSGWLQPALGHMCWVQSPPWDTFLLPGEVRCTDG